MLKVPNAALIDNERRQRLGNEDGNGRQVQEGLRNEGGTDTPPNPPSRRQHTRIRKHHSPPGEHYGDILTDTNQNLSYEWLVAILTHCLLMRTIGRRMIYFHNSFRGSRWESLHTRSACNKTEKLKGDSQIGGTTMLSVNEASHRVNMSGADESGLGRWVWTCYVGKGGKHMCVIQGYRPCHSFGPNTGFSQQQNYFDRITATHREAAYLQRYDTYTKAELKIAILSTRGMQPHDRFLFDLEVNLQHW
eukprot:scaffold12052_cov73-Attheya_sp.AAC.6